ncbi:MAG: hypothetical protein ACK484_01815 [Sphingobacteriales bacterium]|jgi:hypothetical protein
MKSVIVLVFLCASAMPSKAQTKKPAPAAAPVTYTVSLAGFKDGNITAEQFKKVIDSPLVVKDQKGNSFVITRFRINYTFATTYTDSETQQRKSFKDFRAADFYDTPKLPEVWRNSIRDNAKKDDEVIINNIIIKLKDGKKMMLPEWRGTLR